MRPMPRILPEDAGVGVEPTDQSWRECDALRSDPAGDEPEELVDLGEPVPSLLGATESSPHPRHGVLRSEILDEGLSTRNERRLARRDTDRYPDHIARRGGPIGDQ